MWKIILPPPVSRVVAKVTWPEGYVPPEKEPQADDAEPENE